MEFTFLLVLFLSYFLTIRSAKESEQEIPASVRRALILNILNDLNILHDAPIRNSQFVGRKLEEARTDLAIQRAILDHVNPVQIEAPRFEKLVAPSPSDGQAGQPPENLLNEFNSPNQRIKPPSFLQPKRNPPLGIGNPNQFVTRPDSVWAYMNLYNPKTTFQIQTTTAPPKRTFQVSINSPSIVVPPTRFTPDVIGTHGQPNRVSNPTATIASPVNRDPLEKLFYNLLQNHNTTFRLDSDIPPSPTDTPNPTIHTINSTTDTNKADTLIEDSFAHHLSNVFKTPEVFTNFIPGYPNSPSSNPGITPTAGDPIVINTDPMANLFASLLNQSPTSPENVEPLSANLETHSPPPDNILTATASPVLLDTYPVGQDTILNAFIRPPPLVIATTPTPSIYQNVPNLGQSWPTNTKTNSAGQMNPKWEPTGSNVAVNLPPTRPTISNNYGSPNSNLQSGPTIVSSANNVLVRQAQPSETQLPNFNQQSGPTFVPSTNNLPDFKTYPNRVPTNPPSDNYAPTQRDATTPQVSQPNGQQQSANVKQALIQMFTRPPLPVAPSEGSDLSNLETLSAQPTIFSLGSNAVTTNQVANNVASGVVSQQPNNSPTVLPKPQNTIGNNGQGQIIPTVLQTTIVRNRPGINVYPSIIHQNAGTNQPAVVKATPTAPSTIRRPNPFVNTRPVPGNTQVRYPPTPAPSQPTQQRPYYYFDPVTRQYRLANQQVPPQPARTRPTTYPQPPTSNQNAQNPSQTQPTQPRYPNVNNQQLPAGYRPPGYYYPSTGAVYPTQNFQTTEAPEPAEPLEPEEPVEPEEPEEPEEPAMPYWYNGAGSSSSSSDGD